MSENVNPDEGSGPNRGRVGSKATLLLALVGGATIKAAAAEAGVSEQTAHRWLREPKFKAREKQMRAELLATGFASLCASANLAAVKLRELLGSKNEGVALSAARSILSIAGDFQRLFEVEAAVADHNQRLLALEAKRKAHGVINGRFE
jgi:transposase-like protein